MRHFSGMKLALPWLCKCYKALRIKQNTKRKKIQQDLHTDFRKKIQHFQTDDIHAFTGHR
jgi:hypothetical protein